jgi:creatinine amidohydrolase/Fe(II)-dependent formamide hydrolase-like protein
MLLLALQALRDDIAQVINSYVIPELIDWNYSTQRYPQLKLLPPSTDIKVLTKEVFSHMSAARQVNTSGQFWLKLERKMAEMLGFEDEIDYEKLEADMIAAYEERQKAQTGVAQVKVAEKQAATAEKAQKDSAKIAEKQVEVAKKVAEKPTPAPAPAARRQPTRPSQTRK